MHHLMRLALVLLIGLVLLGGCAKDTVTAPDGASQASTDGGETSAAATGEPPPSGSSTLSGQAPPPAEGDSATAGEGVSGEGDAALPPSVEDALLRLRLKQGASYTYAVLQEADGMGIEAKMLITVAVKVLSVQSDGAKLELRVADARLTEGNEAAQQGMKPMLDRIKGQSVEVDVDARGRVKSQSSLPPGSIFGDMLQGGLFRFTLPDKPVRVGSTWTHSANVSGVPGANRPIEYSFKVTGIERNGGRTIVVIESSAAQTMTTGPEGERATQAQVAMKVQGTLRVDAASGLIESATSNTETSVNIAGRTQVMKMAVLVSRK